jgi:putative RecB family exonuclease
MIGSMLREREEAPVFTPHLSYSRMNRYLTCPEQYRLYYVEYLRPRVPSANLVFGGVVHYALARLFQEDADPLMAFHDAWGEAKQTDLDYGERQSWESLRDRGGALLVKFYQEELPRIGTVVESERPFELRLTNLDIPFIGVIDLVTKAEGRTQIVEFKTASAGYEPHEAALSDQLISYHLAVPEAHESAYCVFVKTKEPRIEWHRAKRNQQMMLEFLGKAELVASQIAARQFFKRPGKWCSWCDYLPVCLGDKKAVKAKLMRVPAKPA